MGLFDLFSRKPAPTDNGFFGKLRFNSIRNQPGKGFYSGSRIFAPTGTKIGILLRTDAGAEGPREEQVNFYKEIEEKYDLISKSITPVIEDTFRNWKEDFAIQDFKKEFHPVSLDIPSCEERPIVWEIGFETSHDSNHVFTIIMHGWETKEIQIDG